MKLKVGLCCHYVTTQWIADLPDTVGVLDYTNIAGISEVAQYCMKIVGSASFSGHRPVRNVRVKNPGPEDQVFDVRINVTVLI